MNIPHTSLKRIVVVGGGFAGLKLVSNIDTSQYQIILLDKNNYHQFQPLFYQVATAGLEPSAISFPFRKLFHSKKNIHFRMCTVLRVVAEQNEVHTSEGNLRYDILVIASGADTNYFGNNEIQKNTLPMKSTAEALFMRNTLLQTLENAVLESDSNKLKPMLTIVVVGGGPTGVEVSGALAEMRSHILPYDYPDIDFTCMEIILVDGGDRILSTMSEPASSNAELYIANLGVKLLKNEYVTSYDGTTLHLKSGKKIESKNVIWAAGISPNKIEGFSEQDYTKHGRLRVNGLGKLHHYENIYALGDNAAMQSEQYPNGHPQVAGVAQQQALHLAAILNGKAKSDFIYNDRGSMATIGRNLAVVDFPFMKLQGMLAWFIWMFVHLMLILGVKNRLFIFINWAWSYITFDQSLRLLIKPVKREK